MQCAHEIQVGVGTYLAPEQVRLKGHSSSEFRTENSGEVPGSLPLAIQRQLSSQGKKTKKISLHHKWPFLFLPDPSLAHAILWPAITATDS